MGAFLEGIRVLDLTGALAGPYCTTILSDLGAEVIKIEPVEGDGLRRRKLSGRQGSSGNSLPFDMIHRNKRSLAVDLKHPEGAKLVRRVVETAHVFVENFRPGAVQKLGLSYDDLSAVCPRLVYCSISGFGQAGPMREAKGIDIVAQAFGGLMSVTGNDSDNLAKAGYPIGDLGSAMWGAIAVLGALQRATVTGQGAFLDVSLADAIAAWSLWEVADYSSTGNVPEPIGTAHRLAAPYQAFQCAGGQTLVIGVVERQWRQFCDMLGTPHLLEDDRFLTEYDRYRNRIELAALLGAEFARATRDEWIDRLRGIGVPCGPVNRIDEMLDQPQYALRELFVRDEERFGQPLLVNTPIVADGAPRIRRPAPQIGADTRALLDELGMAEGSIDDLASRGVISVAGASHHE